MASLFGCLIKGASKLEHLLRVSLHMDIIRVSLHDDYLNIYQAQLESVRLPKFHTCLHEYLLMYAPFWSKSGCYSMWHLTSKKGWLSSYCWITLPGWVIHQVWPAHKSSALFNKVNFSWRNIGVIYFNSLHK